MAASKPTLIERVAGGDQEAFAQLVGPHRLGLVKFAARQLGGDCQLAEDVVQDALLNAYRAIRAGSQPESIRAWLFTIVRHCAVNARRGSRATESLQEHHQSGASQDTAAVVEQREWMDWLMGAIGELPVRQRAALVGHAFEGLSYSEIAARESATVPAVKTLIHRARRGLAVSSSLRAIYLPIVAGARRVAAFISHGPDAGKAGSRSLLELLGQALGAATVTSGILMAVPGANPGSAIATSAPHRATELAQRATHSHPGQLGKTREPQQTSQASIDRRSRLEGRLAIASCVGAQGLQGSYTSAALQYASHKLPTDVKEYTTCGAQIHHVLLRRAGHPDGDPHAGRSVGIR